MQLNKIILKNFRNHANAEFSFSNGVTGIVGENGAGKSGVVESILFLMTGEGYGTKEAMINVSHVTGYVIGHFTIEGKPAVLERHLDTSKVRLEYDGVVYKKASEVAGLWDSLFQIDKHIMKNVVVSKQKDIALLFSGDAAVREKLFQKIFMVPNTTKLRDIIWNGYIKQQPPQLAVENAGDLSSELQVSEKLLELARAQVQPTAPQAAELDAALIRQAYVNTCINSQADLEKFSTKISELEAIEAGLTDKIATGRECYSEEAHSAAKQTISNLQQIGPLFNRKQAAAAAVTKAEADLQKLGFTAAMADEVADKTQQAARLGGELTTLRTKYKEVNEKLSIYRKNGLTDAVEVCPTCGSEIKDLQAAIAHLTNELEHITRDGEVLSTAIEQNNVRLSKLGGQQQQHQMLTASVTENQAIVDSMADVNYSEQELVEHKEQLALLAAVKEKIDLSVRKLDAAVAERMQLQTRRASLTVYDNRKKSAAHEQAELLLSITEHREKIAKQHALDIEVAGLEKNIASFTAKIATNNAAIAANVRREKYTTVLEEMYEILHTSKLPRMLIQTYADTVAGGINEVLALFNFPYSVSVNSSFGVDVFNESGVKLPSVSGGQEVMIGMSLRLALHELFGCGFPFMIIDEGSDGLAPKAKSQYFEIIENLKNLSKLKQIIVIDHDPALESAVDHVLRL